IPHLEVVRRYYPAVWDLRNNTEMTPEEFANRAPFRFKTHTFQYFESYGMKLSPLTKIFNKLPFSGLHTVIMHSSVAVVNLSKINDLVKAMHNLSSFLILHLHNNDVAKALKISRLNTREFGEAYPKFSVYNIFYERLPLEMFSYDCRIDLYNFVELLRDHIQNPMIIHLCSSVMEKINDSIPAIKKVSGDPSNGLNIYFPRSKIRYNKYLSRGKIPCPYENLKFSKDASWDEFLKSYLNV
ncbi:MAG: hypothetical protein U9O49_01945, partial [Candidatus Thermoplasmatota archaeon]|nr:hypothetical protein [Candidatus Thermoplasmatota archaeon]